ncbi:MAG: hypothetical protein DWQ19_12950 [Crenarchaeota archaeon]|nr:MAG: hypothetical protein DWQ19_12950 [Thermoproteota archaeon]
MATKMNFEKVRLLVELLQVSDDAWVKKAGEELEQEVLLIEKESGLTAEEEEMAKENRTKAIQMAKNRRNEELKDAYRLVYTFLGEWE